MRVNGLLHPFPTIRRPGGGVTSALLAAQGFGDGLFEPGSYEVPGD
jgi:hypothetical protein